MGDGLYYSERELRAEYEDRDERVVAVLDRLARIRGSSPFTAEEAQNLLIWLEGVPEVTLHGPPIKDPMDKLRRIASVPVASGSGR